MRRADLLGRFQFGLSRFWGSSEEPLGRLASRLNSVDFVDSSCGWIVGDGSVVLATTDGGLSWTMQDPGVVCNLRCVRFIDRERGWAVGSGAHILATRDGGNTWETQFRLGKGTLKSVHFLDSSYGWAVGDVGIIMCTSDGGATWHRSNDMPALHGAGLFMRSIRFVNRDVGWIVGHSQKWPPPERKETDLTSLILATTNGGKNWFQPPQVDGGMLKSVNFIDGKTGWIAGTTLWSTLDGGQSWRLQSNERMRLLNAVFFRDKQQGWSVGQAVVYRTSDGGLTWEAARASPQTQLMEVEFLDADHGWAVGIRSMYSSRLTCGIHVSEDGGNVWRDVELIPDEAAPSRLIAYYDDFTRLEETRNSSEKSFVRSI
jgi:photosystem II stability/assembly factor-like uncharacterized protein